MSNLIASPVIIDAYIKFLTKTRNKTTKNKLPCTFCKTCESSTWRPGPIGPSTLCNKCGVAYMDTGKRNRTIDLILKNGTPMWIKKDTTSWMWKEICAADVKDARVINWINREKIRYELTNAYNPPPAKKLRL